MKTGIAEFDDIVVMDVTMPGLNGIEATKRIVAHFPGTLVVALSIHSEKAAGSPLQVRRN